MLWCSGCLLIEGSPGNNHIERGELKRQRKIKIIKSVIVTAGYSEDSDYTSDVNFPVNGQFPNAATSQYLQVRSAVNCRLWTLRWKPWGIQQHTWPVCCPGGSAPWPWTAGLPGPGLGRLLWHVPLRVPGDPHLCLAVSSCQSLKRRSIRRFVITEKAPTRAFSWLKVPTSAFTFKDTISTLC